MELTGACVMAAVYEARAHLQLTRLEQRLQLQGVAHGEGGAACHPQRTPARLKAVAFRVGQQAPYFVHRCIGGGGHGLPGARGLRRPAYLVVQGAHRVGGQAEDLVGVQRAAHGPHFILQSLRNDL